jgi:hypothetical protein
MKLYVLHFNGQNHNINILINSYIRQPNTSSFFLLSLEKAIKLLSRFNYSEFQLLILQLSVSNSLSLRSISST